MQASGRAFVHAGFRSGTAVEVVVQRKQSLQEYMNKVAAFNPSPRWSAWQLPWGILASDLHLSSSMCGCNAN